MGSLSSFRPAGGGGTPFAVGYLTAVPVSNVTTAAHQGFSALHTGTGVVEVEFNANDITAEAQWLLVNKGSATVTLSTLNWTGVTNNDNNTSTLPSLRPGETVLVHVAIVNTDKFLNVSFAYTAGLVHKGDWDMTPIQAVPRLTADGGNGAVGIAVSINQSEDPLTDLVDITAGGVSIYEGAFYVHMIESDGTFPRPTDTRWSWLEAPGWPGFDNTPGTIYGLFFGYVDATATRQQIIDRIVAAPGATATMIVFTHLKSPSGTDIRGMHVVGTNPTVPVNITGENITIGDSLAFGFNWANGTTYSLHNYSTNTTLTAEAETAFNPPEGMQFRPMVAIYTYQGDDVVEDALKFRIANNGDVARPGYLASADALPPANATVYSAYRVTGAGTFGSKTTEVGDSVYFYPDMSTIQVMVPTRGLNNAEVEAKGYQTEAQVTAIAESIATGLAFNPSLIQINDAHTFVAADKGKHISVNGFYTLTYDATAQNAPDDNWWCFVSSTWNQIPFRTLNSGQYEMNDYPYTTVATGSSQYINEFTADAGSMFLLHKRPGTSALFVSQLRSGNEGTLAVGAFTTPDSITRHHNGATLYALSNAYLPINITRSSAGSLDNPSYPVGFKCRVHRPVTMENLVTIATPGDSGIVINGVANGFYNLRKGETVDVVRIGTDVWSISSAFGEFKQVLVKDHYVETANIVHNSDGNRILAFGPPETKITLSANVTGFGISFTSQFSTAHRASMRVIFQQDGTGGRTLTLDNNSTDFGDQPIPIMPSAPNSQLEVEFWVRSDNTSKVYAATVWRSA